MVRKSLTTAAILCTLGLGSAVAGPTTVVYSDLNLATASGVAALEARLDTAAAAYCTPVGFEYRYMVAPAFAAGATKACIHQAKRLAKFELASVAAPQQLALK
jgi:UrcA family protein